MTRSELTRRLLDLTKARSRRVAGLQAEIDRINAEYDTEARRLHKLIDKADAETAPEPKQPKKQAKRGIPLPEGDELAKLIERYGNAATNTD